MLRCRKHFSINFIRTLTQSHYEVLKVKSDCSHQEVRDAFIKLSKQFHPDTNAGDSVEFRKVMEAYKVLGKTDSRANYDHNLEIGGASVAPGSGFTTNNFYQSPSKFKPDEYYGLKGVKKVTNSKIVTLCAILAVVGILIQVVLVRGSLTFRRKTLDEKSQEAGANHAQARANAAKYGNEGQLERLIERLERK